MSLVPAVGSQVACRASATGTEMTAPQSAPASCSTPVTIPMIRKPAPAHLFDRLPPKPSPFGPNVARLAWRIASAASARHFPNAPIAIRIAYPPELSPDASSSVAQQDTTPTPRPASNSSRHSDNVCRRRACFWYVTAAILREIICQNTHPVCSSCAEPQSRSRGEAPLWSALSTG